MAALLQATEQTLARELHWCRRYGPARRQSERGLRRALEEGWVEGDLMRVEALQKQALDWRGEQECSRLWHPLISRSRLCLWWHWEEHQSARCSAPRSARAQDPGGARLPVGAASSRVEESELVPRRW